MPRAENLQFWRFLCAESDRHIYFALTTFKNRQKMKSNPPKRPFWALFEPTWGGCQIQICRLKPKYVIFSIGGFKFFKKKYFCQFLAIFIFCGFPIVIQSKHLQRKNRRNENCAKWAEINFLEKIWNPLSKRTHIWALNGIFGFDPPYPPFGVWGVKKCPKWPFWRL